MPNILRALFIHGVGEQEADFADDARHHLGTACAARGVALHPEIVHWAPLADRPERAFLRAVKGKGSQGNAMQKLTVGTLADALLYATSPELQKSIFQLLDQQMWMLGGKKATIFAHSLGGLIATDWLRQRPELSDVRLVTLGCNIGLFTLGRHFAPVPALGKPEAWINVFSPRDLLGFPLAVDPALAHVQDHATGVGGWFTGWTGLAHIRYWNDASLWSKKIPDLLDI